MHQHHDGHDHHHHRAAGAANVRRLAWTMALVAVYMVAEVVGGLLSGSLALLADAGHMLSDAGALALSLFAMWLAQKPPTPRQSFGYYRAEILAALANGSTLVAISIFIFVEAYHRLAAPPEVAGPLMMTIAIGGLIVNLIGLWLLEGGRSDNLNVRGAWLHVLTDALGSVATIGAGILIWALGWNWIDPAVSIVIGLLVIYSSWSLLRETVGVLMESTPGHLNVDEIRAAMLAASGVQEVHDLHVWSISSGLDSLSAHVVIADGESHGEVLRELRDVLRHRFGVNHLTIQIEPSDWDECHCPV